MASARGVGSIEIGGRILEVLADAERSMMLRDIALKADLPPGQAHAYLVSLRKLDLVEQDAGSGRYRLGPFALRLGVARLRLSDPYRQTAEALGAFAEQMMMTVAIVVWGTHGPTVVHVHEAGPQIHANVRPGTAFSLTGTASGRVFAAFMSPKLVDLLIEAEFRNKSRTQRAAYRSSLAEFRARTAEVARLGYGTTIDEPVPGISAISAPVVDFSGQMKLAVTLMGPTGALDCSGRQRPGGRRPRLRRRPLAPPRRPTRESREPGRHRRRIAAEAQAASPAACRAAM